MFFSSSSSSSSSSPFLFFFSPLKKECDCSEGNGIPRGGLLGAARATARWPVTEGGTKIWWAANSSWAAPASTLYDGNKLFYWVRKNFIGTKIIIYSVRSNLTTGTKKYSTRINYYIRINREIFHCNFYKEKKKKKKN